MGEHGEGSQLAQAATFVDDGLIVVTLTGEIDMTNAQETRSVLQSQLDTRPDVLIVDLAVGFFGSAGLATLIEAHQRAKQDRVEFAVVAAGHAPRRVIELSGLDTELSVFGSVQEAVEALRRTAE